MTAAQRLLGGTAFVMLAAIVSCAAFADCGFCSGDSAVSESVLMEVRGGFETRDALRASLTLSRSAFVDGREVADIHVDIADIGNMTTAEARALARAASSLVIQSGRNNAVNLPDLGAGATVIQNTRNDTALSALTTIGVQVNSLAAFRELNFLQGLRQSAINAGGVR
jgi:hypothetical protein